MGEKMKKINLLPVVFLLVGCDPTSVTVESLVAKFALSTEKIHLVENHYFTMTEKYGGVQIVTQILHEQEKTKYVGILSYEEETVSSFVYNNGQLNDGEEENEVSESLFFADWHETLRFDCKFEDIINGEATISLESSTLEGKRIDASGTLIYNLVGYHFVLSFSGDYLTYIQLTYEQTGATLEFYSYSLSLDYPDFDSSLIPAE
jgi:hypothetical protein